MNPRNARGFRNWEKTKRENESIAVQNQTNVRNKSFWGVKYIIELFLRWWKIRFQFSVALNIYAWESGTSHNPRILSPTRTCLTEKGSIHFSGEWQWKLFLEMIKRLASSEKKILWSSNWSYRLWIYAMHYTIQ